MDIPEGVVTKPPTVLFFLHWRLLNFWRTKINVIFQQRYILILLDQGGIRTEILGRPLGWDIRG